MQQKLTKFKRNVMLNVYFGVGDTEVGSVLRFHRNLDMQKQTKRLIFQTAVQLLASFLQGLLLSAVLFYRVIPGWKYGGIYIVAAIFFVLNFIGGLFLKNEVVYKDGKLIVSYGIRYYRRKIDCQKIKYVRYLGKDEHYPPKTMDNSFDVRENRILIKTAEDKFYVFSLKEHEEFFALMESLAVDSSKVEYVDGYPRNRVVDFTFKGRTALRVVMIVFLVSLVVLSVVSVVIKTGSILLLFSYVGSGIFVALYLLTKGSVYGNDIFKIGPNIMVYNIDTVHSVKRAQNDDSFTYYKVKFRNNLCCKIKIRNEDKPKFEQYAANRGVEF